MDESTLSSLAFYSARPTLRIDGQDSDMASGLMQSLVMHEQEGGMSSLELAFVNFSARDNGQVGMAFEDEQLLKLGSELKVYAGEAAAPTEIFCGNVSALEFAFDPDGPPRLLVSAEDPAQKARMQRRTTVYDDQSVADITRTVASRTGLTPVITGLGDTSAVEVQLNESDLAFLRRLLARHGADLQIVGNDLQVAPRKDVLRNQVTLRLHSQLHQLRVVADLAHQVSDVVVTGFDPAQGEAIEGRGMGAPLGPGSGRTGKDVLEQAFGERVQQTAHRLALTQSEADALAQAEFEQRARRFVRVLAVCEGNPTLRVGSHVTLADVSPRFDNTYYVTACTHRYDMTRGFETELSAEGAYLGVPHLNTMQRDNLPITDFGLPAHALAACHLARVTDVNDPLSLARVKVELYSLDSSSDTSFWARVASPFAGNARGGFFIPQPDDEVLVVFVQGDARAPVVIGGLWNGAAAPPESINGKVDRWSITGKAGTRIAIVEESDASATIECTTPSGVKLKMTDESGGKVTVECAGNTMTFEPQGVTIEAAAKVKIQAAMVEVSAGMVKVDAAMSNFSGVVKCDTLITNAVVSSSYTPGAGNIW